ncbi:hypothetical protein FOA52_011952 [Chlamydomonas sp. UWO 241]|nr:hypothetical protein FOA52_011952 [Chlamydomonas sp. UWO 241]
MLERAEEAISIHVGKGVIDTIGLISAPQFVAVCGNYAFVAGGSRAVFRVDLTTQTSELYVGAYVLNNYLLDDEGALDGCLAELSGLACDAATGTLYIAEWHSFGDRNVIRQVTANGVYTTVVDLTGASSPPSGLAMDGSGDLLYGVGNDVLKVDPASPTTPATAFTADARVVSLAVAVDVDGAGSAYFTLHGSNAVYTWEAATGDVFTRIAGNGTRGLSGDGGDAAQAQLAEPMGVAVDSAGTALYIADRSNHRIRRVDLTTTPNTISTAAGTTRGFSGDGDAATDAALDHPMGVTLFRNSGLLIADTSNNRLRSVGPAPPPPLPPSPPPPSPPPDACGQTYDPAYVYDVVAVPSLIAVTVHGPDVYAATLFPSRVYKVDTGSPTLTVVAGNGDDGCPVDGAIATESPMWYVTGVAVDGSGSLYVAVSGCDAVYKVVGGTITRFAGSGVYGPASNDGGLATSAELPQPYSLAIDAAGSVFISSLYENTQSIRRVFPNGTITTIATTSDMYYPAGLAADHFGNVWIADYLFVRIWNATTEVVTIVVGAGIRGGEGDGGPAMAAWLDGAIDVAVDPDGTRLYIADSGNYRVRSVDLTTAGNTISTIAGTGAGGYDGDAQPATSTRLAQYLVSVALYGCSELLIADSFELDGRLRRLAAPPPVPPPSPLPPLPPGAAQPGQQGRSTDPIAATRDVPVAVDVTRVYVEQMPAAPSVVERILSRPVVL